MSLPCAYAQLLLNSINPGKRRLLTLASGHENAAELSQHIIIVVNDPGARIASVQAFALFTRCGSGRGLIVDCGPVRGCFAETSPVLRTCALTFIEEAFRTATRGADSKESKSSGAGQSASFTALVRVPSLTNRHAWFGVCLVVLQRRRTCFSTPTTCTCCWTC